MKRAQVIAKFHRYPHRNQAYATHQVSDLVIPLKRLTKR
jgi:uncharacterized protein (DUF924 family)